MGDPLSLFLISLAISFTTSILIYALSPDVNQIGPRLTDKRVQTSTYGAFIQRVYGTTRIAGNILWVENNEIKEVENTEDVGGKGGPSQTITTYTYFATFALALTDNEIGGVSRIWADAVLIYDNSQEDVIKQYESQRVADAITIYPGTLAQLVDPRIEADRPNTPAYRGVSYIVFEDLALHEFGNRIPNITAEVIAADSATDFSDRIEVNTDPGFDFTAHYPIGFNDGVAFSVYSHRTNTGSTDVALVDINANYLGSRPKGFSLFDKKPEVADTNVGGQGILNGGTTWITTGSDLNFPGKIYWENIPKTASFDILAELGLELSVCCMAFNEQDTHLLVLSADTTVSPIPPITSGGNIYATEWYLISVTGLYQATLVDSGTCEANLASGPQTMGLGRGGNKGFGSWDYLANCLENDLKHLWTAYSAGVGNVKLYEIGSDNVLRDIGPTKWKESGGGATGGVPEHATGFPAIIADKSIAVVLNETAIGVFTRIKFQGPESETLSTIVTDMCTNAGIDVGDLDVTALTDEVKGYNISSLNSVLSNLEILQIGYKFDIVESEYKLKFVKRGSSSIATLTVDDLSARAAGEDIPDPLPHERKSSLLMPKRVEVSYYDFDRDYNIGQQYRARRQ